jgi:hypothetical protein
MPPFFSHCRHRHASLRFRLTLRLFR